MKKQKRKIDPAISKYYSELGKKSAKAREKKILEKVKAEQQNN